MMIRWLTNFAQRFHSIWFRRLGIAFAALLLLGIAGAFVGGYLATLLGLGSVSGFNLGSLVIAVVGAMLLLWVHRRIRSSRVT